MTKPSYLCVQASGSFWLSETSLWDSDQIKDRECFLVVDYTIRSSSQSHPFGDTFAEESLEDVLDDSFLYRLDGKTVELEDLYQQFGRDWTDSFLENMPTTRISPMVQDYDPED